MSIEENAEEILRERLPTLIADAWWNGGAVHWITAKKQKDSARCRKMRQMMRMMLSGERRRNCVA